MLPRDRAILRNIVIVMVATTGGLLAIGTSCLGRGRPRPEPGAAVDRDSVRSSAGGVPSAVGTTQITSSQLDRGGSATGSPPRPQPVPSPDPPPSAYDPRMPPMPMGSVAGPNGSISVPMPWRLPPTPPPQMGGGGGSGPMPPGMPMPPGGPATPRTPGSAPAPSMMPMAPPPPAFRTPTQGLEGGAGQFMTEPPPFSASSMTANPEAGAGPFTTDQAQPPQAPPR